MKVPFDTIWKVENGRITNRVDISVGGMRAEARAFSSPIERGATFGGINWGLFVGQDIEIDGHEKDGPFIITGIYK